MRLVQELQLKQTISQKRRLAERSEQTPLLSRRLIGYNCFNFSVSPTWSTAKLVVIFLRQILQTPRRC
jgi:hypothetical protein